MRRWRCPLCPQAICLLPLPCFILCQRIEHGRHGRRARQYLIILLHGFRHGRSCPLPPECEYQRCAAAQCDRDEQSCGPASRTEEHTYELQSLMRTSSAVLCLQKKKQTPKKTQPQTVT